MLGAELAMTTQGDCRCAKLTPVEMDFGLISQVLKLRIWCFKYLSFFFCHFSLKALADVLEALMVGITSASQLFLDCQEKELSSFQAARGSRLESSVRSWDFMVDEELPASRASLGSLQRRVTDVHVGSNHTGFPWVQTTEAATSSGCPRSSPRQQLPFYWQPLKIASEGAKAWKGNKD